ncbi:hypothetical protein OsJ_21825 [Oryza sativa Japonica Group]|uniref:Uncharacterized protein n=1 Tax=Oryza sativa subsp. japonica TaxID=39947 RepID=B9FTY5_ORYSJ|nr:hypothetical protein OsJ_21825 [Oryza sativa Japonica Group]
MRVVSGCSGEEEETPWMNRTIDGYSCIGGEERLASDGQHGVSPSGEPIHEGPEKPIEPPGPPSHNLHAAVTENEGIAGDVHDKVTSSKDDPSHTRPVEEDGSSGRGLSASSKKELP